MDLEARNAPAEQAAIRDRIGLPLSIGATFVAIGAVVIAVMAMMQSSTLKSELRTAQRELRSIGNAEVAETTRQVHAIHSKLEEVGPKIGALLACIPEMQGEIDGLSINWEIPGTLSERKPYFEIANTRQISSDCTSTLYGKE